MAGELAPPNPGRSTDVFLDRKLVCNHTADEAFAELQSQFPNYPLQLVKGGIKSLHNRLRIEIERPRGSNLGAQTL